VSAPGPWKVDTSPTYGLTRRPYVLVREHRPPGRLYQEVRLSAQLNPVRYSTAEAAQRAADKLNAGPAA
jgi:hypothetical protein